jgi:transposase
MSDVRAGIDAHKRRCTVAVFDHSARTEDAPRESFSFKTSLQGVQELTKRIPERSVLVIESSTTGKVLSRMLSGRYEVHMIAPPEKKPSVKTDKRDSERIVKEDMLGYVRRCYIPSQYIEEMRFLVTRQMEVGEKISRVKCQVHALLERNMVQSGFEDLSDIFGVGGLERLSSLELPEQDTEALAMYLEELRLYSTQHAQLETEIARMAESDEDCRRLMTLPGIGPFLAVTIKSRVGDDAKRFPTKKHLCSYAGVVPGADNSGERTPDHVHVKRGDAILKYALTCGVRGAVKARASTAVKRFYLKQVARGKAAQDAEVAAARKLACVVWKILTSKQPYVEENEYLTAKKMARTASLAKRTIPNAVQPESVRTLAKGLLPHADALERYPEEMTTRMRGRCRTNHSLNSKDKSASEDGREERMN